MEVIPPTHLVKACIVVAAYCSLNLKLKFLIKPFSLNASCEPGRPKAQALGLPCGDVRAE